MRAERMAEETLEVNLRRCLDTLPRMLELGFKPPRDESDGAHNRAGTSAGIAASMHAETVSLMYERGDDVTDIAAWWDAHVETVLDLYDFRATLHPSEFMALDWSVGTLYTAWSTLSKVAWSVLLLGAEDPRTIRQVEQVETGVNRVVDLVMNLVVPGREVTDTVRHERPYGPLLAVLEAPAEAREVLMGKFVKTWYNQSRKMPWWGDHSRVPHMYIGYWCLEAAVVSVLLDIDDTTFRDNEFYPADLADHGRALRAGRSAS